MNSSTSRTSPNDPDEMTKDVVKSPDSPSAPVTISRLKSYQMVKSKMAKRLLRINLMLTGFPLVIAVTILICVTHAHMIGMSHTINRYNAETVRDAGQTFHQMATQAVHSSVEQTQQISVDTIRSMTRKMSQDEAASLSTTERDFANLTRTNFDDAMRRSLETNGQTVAAIRRQMSAAFTRSSQQTQSQAAGNVQKAMLAFTDTMMAERARQLSGIVSDRINTNLSYLSLTAQMPALSEGDAKGAKATLDALVRRHPNIMLAAALDREGHEIAVSASDHSVTAQELTSHPEEAYFRAAITGGTYSGLDSVPMAKSAPVLRLAIPIEAYRGKVVGVLAARLSLEDLWDTIRTTVVGHHGFAYVVDRLGHPLLPPRPALQIDKRLESSAVVEGLEWRVVVAIPRSEAMQPILALKHDIDSNSKAALAEIQSGMTRSAQVASTHMQHETQMIRDSTEQRMQERSQGVFKRLTSDMRSHVDKSLTGMQGTVSQQAAANEARTTRKMQQQAGRTEGELTGRVQGLTDDALLSGDRSMVSVALCIVLASCGVAGMLALFTARRIVQPVVDLVEVTQAIARGDLERRVDENATDEIGDLAVAFNTMAASLQTSRAELHTAESQLVQSAKLASLGTLSAGVAHELNQPLAIIRGLAQQLQDEPGLAEDVLADLEIIEGQTSRMSKIIKHMRTFCRTGSQEMVPVEVHRVIQDCLLLVGEQLRQHNIRVDFEFCGGEPIIRGDANELEQVLLNLITNARDALEGRPDACIMIRSYIKEADETTTRARDAQTDIGARLVLEFADNGPGIPEQIANRIFDPFFTTKEAGKGTGLGLSISHTIITRHRGEMRVVNANGAVFILDLPLVEHRIESLPAAA